VRERIAYLCHLIKELYNQRDAALAVPTRSPPRDLRSFRKTFVPRPLFPLYLRPTRSNAHNASAPSSIGVRSRCRHVKEARFFLPDYHTCTLIRANRGARPCGRTRGILSSAGGFKAVYSRISSLGANHTSGNHGACLANI